MCCSVSEQTDLESSLDSMSLDSPNRLHPSHAICHTPHRTNDYGRTMTDVRRDSISSDDNTAAVVDDDGHSATGFVPLTKSCLRFVEFFLVLDLHMIRCTMKLNMQIN